MKTCGNFSIITKLRRTVPMLDKGMGVVEPFIFENSTSSMSNKIGIYEV